MRFSRILFFAACFAFLAANLTGAHVHREFGHHDHVVLDGHEAGHSHVDVVMALDSAHLDEHLLHGDIDLDSSATVPGKTPSLLLVLFGAAFALILINLMPYRRVAPVRPKPRPRSLLREHLQPPSQAPPTT